MSWQYPNWTPAIANRRGFAIWELYYREWGNLSSGSGSFPNTAVDGDVKLPNYHGIAIGSRSTVDRVFLKSNFITSLTEGRAQGTLPAWVDGRKVLEFFACHVGMPLRGQVLGPIVVAADQPYDNTTLYRPDDGTGVNQLLVSAAFEQPALHLQFLQRKQDVSLLNGPRMPMFRQVAVPGATPAAFRLSRILPIAGRRGLTFQADVMFGNGTFDFRLGVIESTAPSNPGAGELIEKTLAIVPGVTKLTAPAYIDLTGRAEYLTVYVKNSVGTDAAYYNLTITDDCCGEKSVALGGSL